MLPHSTAVSALSMAVTDEALRFQLLAEIEAEHPTPDAEPDLTSSAISSPHTSIPEDKSSKTPKKKKRSSVSFKPSKVKESDGEVQVSATRNHRP